MIFKILCHALKMAILVSNVQGRGGGETGLWTGPTAYVDLTLSPGLDSVHLKPRRPPVTVLSCSILACENIRFSSLFAAGARETSPAAKSEEKRMFSQASSIPTILRKNKGL